jgi:hypothetical protein
MIAHIQQQAQSIEDALKDNHIESGMQSRIESLVEELNQLASRDFLTSCRFDFIERRRKSRRLARITDCDWKLLGAARTPGQTTGGEPQLLHRIADAMEVPNHERASFRSIDSAWADAQTLVGRATLFFADLAGFLEKGYGGEGSHVERRTFGWVKNRALRTIVERDYKELVLKVYPSGAWKMTIVAAGSILEAILYDLLTRTPARVKAAESELSAPKKQDPRGPKGAKVPREIKKNTGPDKWDLKDLIRVATKLNLLPADRGNAIDQTLRDWRNFVHPHKEAKADYEITDAEAETAVGNLKCVCNHLEKNRK